MIFINVILQTLHFVHVGKNEDVYHFFFACKNYSEARNNLFNQLFMLDLVNIDTNSLSCGDVHFPLKTNINIFSAVHQFIEESILDSPKNCIFLLVNYYIIICFA